MMVSLLFYTVNVSICMALFYVLYYFILRKLTFFHWNRCYLLLSLTGSIIIPLLSLPVLIGEKHLVNNFITFWEIYESLSDNPLSSTPGNFDWTNFAVSVYVLGFSIVLLKFLISLSLILHVYWQTPFSSLGRIRMVRSSGKITNCSFLDTIFINQDTWTPEEYRQILQHERCHILLMHTYDKLFLNILQILLWYNPFIYLYKRSLEEIHEFEADALLVKATDRNTYVDLLLRFATNPSTSLVHHFSKHPLKSRIQMLFLKKSNPIKKVAYLFSLPLAAFAVLSFSAGKGEYWRINHITNSDILPRNINPTEQTDSKGEAENIAHGAFPQSTRTKSQDKSMDPLKMKDKELNFLESVFFNRRTILTPEGIEFDEIRMNIGSSHIVGHIPKGGKMLYIIKGKTYEEEEIKKMTPQEIKQINCPCKARIINAKIESRINGIYEGIIQIGTY